MTNTLAFVLLLFILIAIIKSWQFSSTIKRKKLKYWVYFDNNSIINSTKSKSAKAKKNQNIYSLILIGLIFLDVVLLLFSRTLQ